MSDLFRLSIIGRAGRDPEARQLPSGDMVANVSVAVSERWRDKATGGQRERTTWINVSFWGGLADVATRYVTKGKQILVEGTPSHRAWIDKNSGEARSALELRATNLQLLGSKSDNANAPPLGGKPATATSTKVGASSEESAEGFQGDNDIPF